MKPDFEFVTSETNLYWFRIFRFVYYKICISYMLVFIFMYACNM